MPARLRRERTALFTLVRLVASVCEKRANERKEHHAWVKVTC